MTIVGAVGNYRRLVMEGAENLARIPQMDYQFDDLLGRFCYKNQCNTIIATAKSSNRDCRMAAERHSFHRWRSSPTIGSELMVIWEMSVEMKPKVGNHRNSTDLSGRTRLDLVAATTKSCVVIRFIVAAQASAAEPREYQEFHVRHRR